jgi:hypothetical protein
VYGFLNCGEDRALVQVSSGPRTFAGGHSGPRWVDGDEGMSRQHMPPWLVERLAQLSSCDSYVILTIDRECGEIDAQGPLDGLDAVFAAHDSRRELDDSDLSDIQILIAPLHLTKPARSVT